MAFAMNIMPDNKTVINQTKKWLSTVIIQYSFCPFAQREFDNDRIDFAVIETVDVQSQLEHFLMHCLALDKEDNRETSLLIFPNSLSDFENYLDVLDMADALLKQQGYEGVYQLASFHPQYRFADANPDDPSNYTNRSPYPMIHILREASVETALKNYPHPENIPVRNIRLTKELGLKVMQELLAGCYK